MGNWLRSQLGNVLLASVSLYKKISKPLGENFFSRFSSLLLIVQFPKLEVEGLVV